MPVTYTDEVNIYNPNAIQQGISDASETATDYITNIDNTGVKVSPNGLKGVDWTQITPGGMEVYKTAESVAKFGQETRIGSEAYSHQTLGADGYNVYQGADSVFAVEPYGPETAEVTPYGSTVTIPANGNQAIPAGPSLTFSNDPTGARAQAYCASLTAQGRSYPYQAYLVDGTTRTRIPLETEVDDTDAADYWAKLTHLRATDPTSGATVANVSIGVFNNTSSAISVVVGTAQDTRPMRMRVGKEGESHMELDYHSMQLVDKEDETYFHVSDLRDADGYATLVQNFDFKPLVTSISQVELAMVASSISYIKLINTVVDPSSYSATESSGHTVITFNPPLARPSGPPQSSGIANAIQVEYKTDRDDYKCLTFGSRASSGYPGPLSATFGDLNFAESLYSFASGHACNVTGVCSGAIGEFARAWGDCSVAFGYDVTASGPQSVAQNLGTKAAGPCQTVLGKYNVEDSSGNYAVIVGNGASNSARSNALAVGWDGSVTLGHGSDNTTTLNFESENRTGRFMKLYGAPDANGDAIVMGAGGAVVVGSGESAQALYDALSLAPGNEVTHIASDGSIYFWSNCNTIANRKQMTLDTAGTLNNNGAIVSTNNTFYADSTVAAFDRDGAAPSADTWKGGLVIRDKDKENFAQVAAVKRSSANGGWNEVGIYPYAENSSGTQIDNALVLGVKSDGSRRVLLNQAAWIKALGLDSLVKVVSASSGSISIAANSNHTFAPELTIPSGYTLVGALGAQFSANAANLSSGEIYKYSANKIAVNVVNHGSSARSVNVTTYGLCVKTAFVR